MSQYIEERLDNLQGEVEELSRCIGHLIKIVQKAPLAHSKDCIEHEENWVVTIGCTNGNCYCDSDFINKTANLNKQPILYEARIKELRKEYSAKKKAEREKRKARKLKKKAKKI